MIRRLATLIAFFLVFGAAMAEWNVEPPRPQLGDPDTARLLDGEVLVENALVDESGGAATVRAVFWTQGASTWDMLGDCEVNYRFVDGLRDCELLESSETRALTRQAVKKHFLTPRMEYVFETARQPGEWVNARVSGAFGTDMEATVIA